MRFPHVTQLTQCEPRRPERDQVGQLNWQHDAGPAKEVATGVCDEHSELRNGGYHVEVDKDHQDDDTHRVPVLPRLLLRSSWRRAPHRRRGARLIENEMMRDIHRLGVSGSVDVLTDDSGRYLFDRRNRKDGIVIDGGDEFASLLAMLDGTLTGEEISATLAKTYSHLSIEDVRESLQLLINEGIVRSHDVLPTSLRRYARQLNLLSEFGKDESVQELQQRFTDGSVAVLGLGATGTAVATALVCAGVGRVRLVDFDTVDVTNLSRQYLFTEDDVGRAKLDVAVDALHRHNSSVALEAACGTMSDPISTKRLIDGVGVVVNCADSPSISEVNHWLRDALRESNTTILSGAGYRGNMGWIGPTFLGDGRTCWHCYVSSDPRSVAERDASSWRRSVGFAAAEAGSVGPFAAILGNIQAWECMRVLQGLPTRFSDCSGEFDLLSFELRHRPLSVLCDECEPSRVHHV